MRLINETYFEDVKVVQEAVEDGRAKEYFIEGVFAQADIRNRNGRIYPLPMMVEEVERYRQTKIAKNRAIGELEHPTTPKVNLKEGCISIQSLVQEGKNFIGRSKVLSTPNGQIVKSYIDDGVGLGISSRGVGDLREDTKAEATYVDGFCASAWDVVSDPSGPDCFVNGVMEGVEWIYENNIARAIPIIQGKSPEPIDEEEAKEQAIIQSDEVMETMKQMAHSGIAPENIFEAFIRGAVLDFSKRN